MKFTNKRSVAAATASPSQPSNRCVKIKGHIDQRISENRKIKADPKSYEINFGHGKKQYANGLQLCRKYSLKLECRYINYIEKCGNRLCFD